MDALNFYLKKKAEDASGTVTSLCEVTRHTFIGHNLIASTVKPSYKQLQSPLSSDEATL
jgi:hypothetical protein